MIAPLSDFTPRFPWFGGDLQTLRNFIVRPRHDLSSWPERRIELPMADDSGDRLLGVLHQASGEGSPLVVLIHGLTGCQDSFYITTSAMHFLERGCSVLRLNLRGAGPGRQLARGGYNAGKSEDLRDALAALGGKVEGTTKSELLLVGYSLGGNMLLKFLAECGREFPIRAAAVISVPIDLKATQERIMAPRNRLYHAYLLNRMKAELRARPGGLSPELEQILQRVDSVRAFDDLIVAPDGGFEGAEAYYANSSAKRFLAGIEVSTLVLQAADDPWIPEAVFRALDWDQYPRLKLWLLPGGGHVGFHARGSCVPLHDQAMAAFFKAV